MFTPFDHEDSALDAAIAAAFLALKNLQPDTKEYQQVVDRLTDLYALKNQTAKLNLESQKESAAHVLAATKQGFEEQQARLPFYQRVDPNTVLTVAGNLVLGLIVVKYEQTGVISSKVMSFMKKI